MQAAERAARIGLHLVSADIFAPVIEIEGISIPLSQALTAPEAELPPRALEFKQAFFDFMADKTISEAARAVVDGESPGGRLSRAAGGKNQGGITVKIANSSRSSRAGRWRGVCTTSATASANTAATGRA